METVPQPGLGETATGSGQAAPRTRYRFWVLAALCSLAFLTYLDRICIMRAQGEIERDLQFGQLTAADEARLAEQGLANDAEARAKLSRDRATERMSWVFSAFVFGYLLFEVPGGWLGDRWGARALIFRIVLWWSFFTGLTGGVKWIAGLFSTNPGPEQWFITMVAVRFLFGLGEAGAYPNIARALGRWFPYHERASAQSFIWLSSRWGGAFAPAIIGGLMLWGGGWQRAFWILGACGIIWAFFFFAWFRNRPEDKSQVNEAERAWIRAGAVEAGSIYDDSTAARMPWSSLVSFNVLALCLASFCVSFCFYFYITFLPKYLKEQFGVDYAQSQFMSGLPLLLGGLACLAGGFLSDWAVRRTGSKRWGRSLMPMIGWGTAGACAFLVPQVGSAAAVVCLLALGFAFQDLGVPSIWSLPADIGGRFAGTVGGWMNMAGCVGGMLSPLISAKMSIAYGWNSTFLVFGSIYVLGALSWLKIDASRPIYGSNR